MTLAALPAQARAVFTLLAAVGVLAALAAGGLWVRGLLVAKAELATAESAMSLMFTADELERRIAEERQSRALAVAAAVDAAHRAIDRKRACVEPLPPDFIDAHNRIVREYSTRAD